MAARLQACLNGGRTAHDHPAVPLTPAALARDAVAVRPAGADCLHLHPRDSSGAESLAPADVAAALAAVRRAVPGMPVGIGTGAWIAPGGRARQAHIRGWQVLPDYVSVNLNEPDAPEVMEVVRARGIGIEAGLWTAADAGRFVRLPQAPTCLRVLVEVTDDDPAAAQAEAERVLAILDAAGIDLPVLLHGEGGSVWEMVEMAAARGFATRVGFEDGLTLPDGSPAASNAALVAAAARILAGAD
jgi:uncharacterized protein (DUF849 family)